MGQQSKSFQQSVLLALDTETGKLIESKELLHMAEDVLRDLRRSSVAGLHRSRVRDVEPRLRCALCNGPAHISMRHTELGNRWFAHNGEVTDCPYRDYRRLSPDEQWALQYQGQQEGAEHKRLKFFIADWVEKDSRCSGVWRDKVRVSELKRGEWKRPDVRTVVGDREIVFEIQLSYTFLSEVVRRDAFYQQENVHILWIFREFEPHREVVRDEMFYNRRNIFVLDADAEKETIKRNRLTFKCYYQTPALVGDDITEKWHSRYVHLDELQFPLPEYRPYYRDFDTSVISLLRLRLIRAIMQWSRDRKVGGSTSISKAKVLSAWQALERKSGFKKDKFFFASDFLFEELPKFLSIKYKRPIGYNYKMLWEVLNAILAMSISAPRPHNIQYLMAIQHYAPNLEAKHAQKIIKHRSDVIASIKGGETHYIRDQRFDEATAIVLPELRDKLEHPWGVKRT
jgi:hypothetical protein